MNGHPAGATFDGNPSGRPALSREQIATFDAAMQPVRFEDFVLSNGGNRGQSYVRRELRNDVAHNAPTPRLMADASDKMANENLWSRDSRFLTMPLVQNVLRDLGEKDPERLCDSLIATVRSRLLDLKSDN